MAGGCPGFLPISFSFTCCLPVLQTPRHPSKSSLEGPPQLGSRWAWGGRVQAVLPVPGDRRRGAEGASPQEPPESPQPQAGRAAPAGEATAALITQPSKCSGSLSNWRFISNYCLYSKHRLTGGEESTPVALREAPRQSARLVRSEEGFSECWPLPGRGRQGCGSYSYCPKRAVVPSPPPGPGPH